jgi:hypothetical protein
MQSKQPEVSLNVLARLCYQQISGVDRKSEIVRVTNLPIEVVEQIFTLFPQPLQIIER